MNENMKDFDLIKKMMVWSGQWQAFSTYPRLKVFMQKLRVMYFIVLSPLTVVSMFLSGFMDSLSKYAIFTVCSALIDPMAYSFVFKWDHAKRVYTRLRAIVAKRDSMEHIRLFKTKSKAIWNIVILFGATALVVVIIYEILPYFYDGYLAFFTDSDKPFMTPIPNQGFLDKEPKRTLYYYSVNLITTLWCIDLAIVLFAFDSFTYLIIIYSCIELEIISEKVRAWGKEGAVGTLREIVEEHQEFLRLKDDIVEFLGVPMASQNTIGSLSLTVFAYTAVLKYETDKFVAIINIVNLALAVIVIVTACYAGEKLEEEGEKFFQTLYDTQWYILPKSEQTAIRIMMLQAIKPLAINYKGWSPVNLVTFKNVVNASYSYFMMLNSMK